MYGIICYSIKERRVKNVATLIIKDEDTDNIQIDGSLTKANISIKSEKELTLELTTSDKSFSYEIKMDTREPDIIIVRDFILQKLVNSFNKNQPFFVSECCPRHYVTIGDIDYDEKVKKFSGYRKTEG